jgi:hypothetical protein
MASLRRFALGAAITRHLGLAIGLAAAAALSVAGTAAAAPQSPAQRVAAPIESTVGWQYSNAILSEGLSYTVKATASGPDGKAGTWTVDYRTWPPVGPNGYDSDTDGKIYVGCKLASDDKPYGLLLGRIGEDGDAFEVGAGRTFQANRNGQLYLRINDQDRCLVDNQGYMFAEVMGP